ncbi:hypothetical protein I4U23_003001 [Adineta vaga]|nr:hypothetical protein I4U23_003001 [Adineta vaga]
MTLTRICNPYLVDNTNDIDEQNSPSIFCFVLSSNDRHLTSSRAIVYSWGKRCDRFYFVTRLQNTSVDLMMIEHFENTSNITPMTITQQTLEVLIYLYEHHPYSSYHWFVRASDDSFVIMPNLRRLINQLHLQQKKNKPIVHVGDVDELYKKRQIKTTGSVMLFNRYALQRLLNIQINPINENLILSQNLSFYKMDKQFKVNSRPITEVKQRRARYNVTM